MSMNSVKWQHWMLAAAGGALTAGILYYFLRDDNEEETGTGLKKDGTPFKPNETSMEKAVEILRDIIKSQEGMKNIMRELTAELTEKKYNFVQTYKRVSEIQPNDPLAKHNLSMSDFDQMLEEYQNDAEVKTLITQILGAPASMSMSPAAQKITKVQILKVHEFMLDELKKAVEEFTNLPNQQTYDMKTVTIAAQALVGAKVEEKFGFTSEDIEGAVLLHHSALSQDAEFARINLDMQSTMQQLMGGTNFLA